MGLDRTASLEALSLLELPHLQGMTNLAVLGLGPTTPYFPPAGSAGASGSGSSVGTTPVKVRLVDGWLPCVCVCCCWVVGCMDGFLALVCVGACVWLLVLFVFVRWIDDCVYVAWLPWCCFCFFLEHVSPIATIRGERIVQEKTVVI